MIDDWFKHDTVQRSFISLDGLKRETAMRVSHICSAV